MSDKVGCQTPALWKLRSQLYAPWLMLLSHCTKVQGTIKYNSMKIASRVFLNLFISVIVQILGEQNSVARTLILVLFIGH